MRRSTRAYITKLAEQLGVDLDITHDGYVDCWSPSGQAFAASGCHVVTASAWDDDPITVAFGSIADDLEAGLVPCTIPDCENCNTPHSDPNWSES